MSPRTRAALKYVIFKGYGTYLFLATNLGTNSLVDVITFTDLK